VLAELKETLRMSEILPYPEDHRPEEDDEEVTGASSDPLAEPPGTHGRKARNPYEGTEPGDEPGPSLGDLMEDHTPATDEQLQGGPEDCL
jgi:hypothetical protein